MPSTCVITHGLLAISSATAPTPMIRLRSPIDRLEPTMLWITVVSVVMRLMTSPVWVVSKNSGLCRSTWL